MRNQVRTRAVAFPMERLRPRRVPSEPRFGVVSPADVHPAVVPRSREEILTGFQSQVLRMEIGGTFVEFTSAPSSDGRYPFAHPVIVASTSVREYVPWPAHVHDLDYLRAVGVAPDRQWIDRMLVMRDHPEARSVAREYGGRFALQWSKSGVAVLDLETDQVMSRFLVRGRAIPHRPCPLIPGAVPGDRCKMYGGPWVQQSMVASSYWMDRRYLYEQELGCDEECSPPAPRHRTKLPTRYFTWLWQSEIETRWEDLVASARSE